MAALSMPRSTSSARHRRSPSPRPPSSGGGAIHLVGIAGGTAQWSFFTNPYEATLANSCWGTIEDLHEVERSSMDDALEAYRRLRDGEVDARADVVPHA